MADTLSDNDIARLANATGGRGNSEPRAAASGGADTSKIIEGLQNLGKDAVPAYMGFRQLTTDGRGLSTAFGAVSSALNTIGLSKFGGLVGEVGQAMIKGKESLDAAGKIGIGGNDIGRFNEEARLAGMTTAQYVQTIKNADGSLNGLAGTAGRSATAYSKFAADIQMSPAAASLQRLGIQSDEMASISALSLMNSTKLNMSDSKSKADAIKAASELAFQIDATSKITGMNREAIGKSVEAEMKKPGVMLATMAMDETSRQQFMKTQAQLSGLGPAVQGFASEIVTGGIRTAEGRAQMAALGPAGIELQNAIKQQQAAKTEDQKAEAKLAVDRATESVNTYMRSAQFAKIANTSTGEVKDQMLRIAGENKSLTASYGALMEAGGDPKKAAQNQKNEVEAAQQGLLLDDKGKPKLDAQGKTMQDPGQASAVLMNEVNRNVMIQAGGAAMNLRKMNDELGSSPKLLKDLNDGIRIFTGNAKTFAEAATNQRAVPAQALQVVKDATSPVGIRPGVGGVGAPPGYTPGQPISKRDGGTEEKTGQKTEPADVIAQLHKGEIVLNTAQAAKYLGSKDAMSSGINGADISETIRTSISGVTGNTGEKKPQVTEEVSMSDLVKKGQEALAFINKNATEKINEEFVLTELGRMRLRTGIKENGDFEASMNQNFAKTRLAELVAKAEAIKAQESKSDSASIDGAVETAKKETGIAGDRQVNIAKAYEAMQSMDQAFEDSFADIQGQLTGIKLPDLADFEDSFTGIKDQLTGIKLPTIGESADKISGIPSANPLGDIKTKFSSMFESFNPQDMFKSISGILQIPKIEPSAKIETPKIASIPKPETKKEEPKPTPKVAEEVASRPQPKVQEQSIGMKDLYDQLNMLNKSMVQVILHVSETAGYSAKTAKNSAKATGNRMA